MGAMANFHTKTITPPESVLVIGNRWQDSPLARAERVDNYLGLPARTGVQMLEEFYQHAQDLGVEFVTGRVVSAMNWNGWHLTVGSQVYEGAALILAPGVGIVSASFCIVLLYSAAESPRVPALFGLSSDLPCP